MTEQKHPYEIGKYYWAKKDDQWEIVQYDVEPWECFWCMGTEISVDIDSFEEVISIPIEPPNG